MADYKKQGRKLKKAGIINFDLRRNLTPQQKAAITRQSKKYGEVLDSDQFVTRHISTKKAKILKGRGYATYNNKVWIPTDGAERVQVTTKWIKGKKMDVIKRTKTDKKMRLSEIELIIAKDRLHDEIEAQMATMLPRGQFYTARFFGHSAFSDRFTSLESLNNYLKNFTPKDKKTSKDELLASISIISIDRL